MSSNYDERLEQLKAGFQQATKQWISAQVCMGLALDEILASVPGHERPGAAARIAELAKERGHKSYSWVEAEMLSRLAKANKPLADPEQVDLDDPVVQQLKRQLRELNRGINSRLYQAGVEERLKQRREKGGWTAATTNAWINSKRLDQQQQQRKDQQ